MPIKCPVTVTSEGSSSVLALPKPVLYGFNPKKGDKLKNGFHKMLKYILV
jgi:hypothetical protein